MNSAIDFTNKTFVVAGAGGIGAATAKTLNAYGARILLHLHVQSLTSLRYRIPWYIPVQ